MHPVEALERCGGVASRQQLLQLSDRASLERLLRSGDVVRDARGRYALPRIDSALRAASSCTAVVSHLSAALLHGWEVKQVPALPHVTVPRNRNVSPAQRRLVVPHWAPLHVDDVLDGIVTSKPRTLADCLSVLPFDEALAVADSALRHEDVTPAGLVAVAGSVTSRGARRARRVARLADSRAANPFESVLRAISLDIRGLDLVPQQAIRAPGFFAKPDLVDLERRLVVEADSHTWHSSRKALRRDCRRYTDLTLLGWLVLRFAWEDVMFHPDYVRRCLEEVARVAAERAKRPSGRRKAA